MNNSKDSILTRISNSLQDIPLTEKPEDVLVPRNYRVKSDLSKSELLELFIERVTDYKANVQIVNEDQVSQVIAEVCQQKKIQKVVVSESFQDSFKPKNVQLYIDQISNPMAHSELDDMDAVITTSALGVAETGSIALDAGNGQGRRALSLIPDIHICLVRQADIVELIPEAFQQLYEQVANQGSPITLISGPSATSDIELNRVEGVHGPRVLEVLVITDH